MMTLKLAWRNIWRNTRRTLITSAAIAAAVLLALFMRSMQTGMYDQLLDNIVGKFSGYVQVHGQGYWDERTVDNTLVFSDSLEKEILEVDGVNGVVPRLETFALSAYEDLTKGVFIQGVIPEKENILKDFNASIDTGQIFDPEKDEVLIGKGIAKFYQVDLGDTLIFIGQGYHGQSAAGKFVISGIMDLKNPQLNKQYVVTSVEAVQRFIGGEGITSSLVLATENSNKEIEIAEALKEKLNPELYEVMTWQEMMPEIQQLIQADQAGDMIFIGILYMIISFGIFGTILMMTQERMYEFGVLLSIGMSRLKIIKVMVLESFFLAILGLAAGIAFIMPIIYYINANPIYMGDEIQEMMESYGFDAQLITNTSWTIPMNHTIVILVITMLLTLYPMWVIRKLNPIKAMKK